MHKRLFNFIAIATFISASVTHAAVTFTGNVTSDFEDSECISDPGAQDILWSAVSGFDINRLCMSYDDSLDRLYVGIETLDPETGNPVITGDADGDGNPSSAGTDLANTGGKDLANFGPQEFLSIILDFDHQIANGFDFLIGVRPSDTLSAFNGYFPASDDLNFANTDSFFGANAGATVTLFASPSSGQPHLELSIDDVSLLPGIADFNLDDPFDQLALYMVMGSYSDGPIGDDIFPGGSSPSLYFDMYSLPVSLWFGRDSDGDGVGDALDLDDDGDGLSDLVENHLSQYDTDGDGVLSVSQDANGNGTIDAGEEGEIRLSGLDTNGNEVIEVEELPGGVYPDFDNDGTPNYLDTDSDNDGIVDGSDPYPFSVDGDGDTLSDADETNTYHTDPTIADTDGGGITDGVEVARGTDPLDPVDDLPVPATSTPEEQAQGDPDLAGYNVNDLHVQGSGLGSCSLQPTEHRSSAMGWMLAGSLLLLLSFRFRRGWILLLILAILPLNASALNVQRQRPNATLGGFFLPDADMLGMGNWLAGASINYSNQPIEVGLKTSSVRVDNIVNHMLSTDFTFGYGLVDWIDLGIGLEANLFNEVEPIGTAVSQSRSDFGDMLLEAKIKWDHPSFQRNGFGFAAMPFLTIPTGSATYYIGDKSVTGGFRLVGEKWWGNQKIFANIGTRFRETERLLNLTVAHEFLYGLGASKTIIPEYNIDALIELNGSTTYRQFFSEANSSPIELMGGARAYLANRTMWVDAGAGLGLNTGYGAPDIRVYTAFHFSPIAPPDRDGDGIADRHDRCPDEASVAGFDRAFNGCPESMPVVETTPEPAPEPMNKTVYIEDNRIVVLRPINFEYNSDILLDESKEILNNVALLLNQTPQIEQVLITGHTDSDGGLRFNQTLSEKRAAAVKTYLTSQGIPETRFRTQGWGETRPLVDNKTTADKAINRRVEFQIMKMSEMNTHTERVERTPVTSSPTTTTPTRSTIPPANHIESQDLME